MHHTAAVIPINDFTCKFDRLIAVQRRVETGSKVERPNRTDQLRLANFHIAAMIDNHAYSFSNVGEYIKFLPSWVVLRISGILRALEHAVGTSR